jgi:hypothetical protein
VYETNVLLSMGWQEFFRLGHFERRKLLRNQRL